MSNDPEVKRKKILKDLNNNKPKGEVTFVSLEDSYFIKPALHIDIKERKTFVAVPKPWGMFKDGKFISGTTSWIVTSNPSFWPLNEENMNEKRIFPRSGLPNLQLPSRWSHDRVENFVRNHAQKGDESDESDRDSRLPVFLKIRDLAIDLFDFPKEEQSSLLALWIIGTYIYPIFDKYPFLNILGTKNSGKTKLQDFLRYLCFNAEKTDSISTAALFRLAESNMSTILIDEGERLTGYEADPDLRLLLNACHSKSGTVIKVNKETHKPERYYVYVPVSIAAINPLEPTLESRCIGFLMMKTIKNQGRKKINDDTANWELLRDDLYNFLLNDAPFKIYDIYKDNQKFDFLNTRKLDLWQPLLSIALYFGEDTFNLVKSLIEEEESNQPLTDDEEKLLTVLLDSIKKKDTYTTKTINTWLKNRYINDDEEKDFRDLKKKFVSNTLRKFGFVPVRKTRDGNEYLIDDKKITSLIERYEIQEKEIKDEKEEAKKEEIGDQRDDTLENMPF